MPLTPTLTNQQMTELERLLTDAYGITLIEKIERAGRALAESGRRLLGETLDGRVIIVLAGAGNNGAVGLAAARLLHEGGATVRTILSAKPTALHEMAAHQYALLRERGLYAWGLSMSETEMADQEPIPWTAADLVIDALLGTGLEGEPRGDAQELIRLVNSSRRPILSFDMPSGLSGDEGYILSPCIDATATLAMSLPRVALVEGWPVAGEIWVADMGVPTALFEQLGLEVAPELYGGEPVACLGPARALKPPRS